jgi:hypothetical protein
MPQQEVKAPRSHIDYGKLPTNENGDPEYASYCLTIDGRIPNRGNHIVDKLVASTQSAEETLDNLFAYYKEQFIRDIPTTVDIIGRGYNAASAYIYVTATGVIQIVVASATLNWLVQDENIGNGSLLVALEKLKGMVAAVLEQGDALQGEVAPLHLLSFELSPVESEQTTEGDA